jgi:hypothetical protein
MQRLGRCSLIRVHDLCRPAATPGKQVLGRGAVADDLAMDGLPDSFCLTSFREANLMSAQRGQYRENLGFDVHNRGVSIQSRP